MVIFSGIIITIAFFLKPTKCWVLVVNRSWLFLLIKVTKYKYKYLEIHVLLPKYISAVIATVGTEGTIGIVGAMSTMSTVGTIYRYCGFYRYCMWVL